MIILGIESSCDETGIALIHADEETGLHILSNQVASQISLHAPFGGVVPEIASRAHLSTIDPLLETALSEAGITDLAKIDAIAVTQGPGLIGALLVGASYAKGLALSLGKPLIPVDHVEAHVHGALLGLKTPSVSYKTLVAETFPALSLVVSGGHTNLYFMQSPTEFELLGYSVDDACGECFDKVGKLLGFPYPAGPMIERYARQGLPKAYPMPQVLPIRQVAASSASLSSTTLASTSRDGLPTEEDSRSRVSSRRSDENPILFSYSGLKTFMAQTVTKIERALITKNRDNGTYTAQNRSVQKSLPEAVLYDLCASFQDEALGQIVRKTKEALGRRPEARSVLVAGGVSANERFRAMLSGEVSVSCIFPPAKVCSDNGAMIAAYAYHQMMTQGITATRAGQTAAFDPVHAPADPQTASAPGCSSAFFDHHWECYSRYRFPAS